MDHLNLPVAILVYKYCQQYLYKKGVQVLLFFSQKVELYDYDFFSVLLWSFKEIVFLFKES